MKRSVDLFNQAVQARQTGNVNAALAYLEQAIAISPQEPRNYFLLGLTLEDLHRPDEAITNLQTAIHLKPDYAEAYNNIGLILHDQKRFDEAITNFRRAIHHKPDYARAYNNLGTLLRARGDISGAQQQFEQAVRLKPDYVLAYYNLGINCMDLGQMVPAEINLSQAIRLKRDYVQAYNPLGCVQQLLGKLDEAQASFAQAAKMRPGKNGTELNNLAYVLWEQGRTEQAIATYRQTQILVPHELKSALGSLLSLPAVYRDQNDVLAVRARFENGLRILIARIPEFVAHNQPESLLGDLRWNNFYLAYQGCDDKKLQIDYASFVATLLENIAPQWMQPLAKKNASGRRLRIGYLSSFFKNCTVGMYFRSWIMQLDRGRFETFVYHIRLDADNITQEIADGCGHFRHIAGSTSSPGKIATTVLEDDLDILVYPELGMDNTCFMLAAMRLAPLQCAGWGHPVTSGHPNIDCYFSTAIMEPENAEAHYSEKLVLLDGIGTYYSKPVLPTPGRRADFSLPEGKTLYLCPQSLFKIHPDNDVLLARILEGDPNGVVVLFAGRHPNITNTLFARLALALRARGVDPLGRGVILPSMSHDDYLRVNILCDVMLDTLHWSGGNTTLDALASCLPVVTLPGEFMRGRQSYGMLKCMGLDELIAKDQDDYVAIATRLGTDSVWRQQVAQHISANNDVIFDDEKPLRQLEQFFWLNGVRTYG